MYFGAYHQDTILVTREDDIRSITEPIYNVTAKDLSSVPKLLSALQKMVQDNFTQQMNVQITVEERDLIVQLFEELNIPLSDVYETFIFFEDVLFVIILGAIVS